MARTRSGGSRPYKPKAKRASRASTSVKSTPAKKLGTFPSLIRRRKATERAKGLLGLK